MANPIILKMTASGDAIPKVKLLSSEIQKMGKKTKAVGNIMKGVLAAKFISQGVEAIKNGFRAMGAEALKYEDTLKSIQGITTATSKDMITLHKAMIANSNVMEQAGSKAAEAGLNINKMGFSAAESAKALEQTMNLATASIVDVNDASKVSLQTMKAFGLGLGDLEHIVNVIQSTVSGTSIDFMDFAEAMKFVAPIAKKVGVSLEETSASIGFLGNIGLKGSIGGTALKNMLLNLLTPGESVSKMLGRMDNEGAGLVDILSQMKDEGMSINQFIETFNKRALAGALSISEMGKQVNDLTKALTDEETKARDVANVMRDSLIKQLEIMRNNLLNVGNEFIFVAGASDGFKDAFAEVNIILQETQKWVVDNDDKIKQFAKNIISGTVGALKGLAHSLKFIADNSAALSATLKLMVGIKLVPFIVGLGKAALAMKAFMVSAIAVNPPLVAIAAALVAVNAAMALYIDHVDKMVEKNARLNQSNKSNLEAQSNALGTFVDDLILAEQQIKAVQESADDQMIKGFKVDAIKENLEEAGNAIELKFGLPDKFLDAMTDSKSAFKQSEFLRKKLIKMELDSRDKNVQATDENTDAVTSLLEELKKAGATETKDKGKGKDPIDETIKLWSQQLSKDMESSIKSAFLTFDSGSKTAGGVSFGLRTSQTIGEKGKQRDVINQEGLDTIHFDLLDLNNTLRPDLVPQKLDDIDKILTEVSNNIHLMNTPSNLPTGFTGTSSVSPLTQVSSTKSFSEAGNISFDIQMIPSFVNLKKKFENEEFRVNLGLAELDNLRTEDLIRDIEAATAESKALGEEIKALEDELKVMEQTSQESMDRLVENIFTYGDIALEVVDLISQAQTNAFEKEQELFDKRLKDLNVEKSAAIKAHKDKESSLYLINREFAKKEADLKAQQEKADEEFRKKQKASAIVSAAINTALAITSVLSNPGSFSQKLIQSAIVGGLGLAQIGVIASQEFKGGGEIRGIGAQISGPGSGTSDSIPILASDREFMLKAQTVDALGGAQGVVSMVDRELDRTGTSNDGMTIYIENAFDDAERIRETYAEVFNERQRWN